MDTLIVTTSIAPLNRVVDLELSSDVPMWQLIPALATALKLPQPQPAGRALTYQFVLLRNGVQRPLGPNETLQDADVLTGDFLSLVQAGARPQALAVMHAGPTALLRTQAGKVIVLDNFGLTRLRVGRYDALNGIAPEIELSDDPAGSTVSRDHARLDMQKGQWALMAISSSSLTHVNDQRLQPGQSQLLKNGDHIRLGDVHLNFEIASLQ
ncbi:MAG: FHA domain-containing protein [Anaerolineae bacterium]|nr:FHA domain-containing protein [Anaerolineae bacterium]